MNRKKRRNLEIKSRHNCRFLLLTKVWYNFLSPKQLIKERQSEPPLINYSFVRKSIFRHSINRCHGKGLNTPSTSAAKLKEIYNLTICNLPKVMKFMSTIFEHLYILKWCDTWKIFSPLNMILGVRSFAISIEEHLKSNTWVYQKIIIWTSVPWKKFKYLFIFNIHLVYFFFLFFLSHH